MKHLTTLLSLLLIASNCLFAQSDKAYTVIANPGEDASTTIRLNWHTDTDHAENTCFYTRVKDKEWKKAKQAVAQQELCTTFDSIYSRSADNKNFYERVRFLRNTVELTGLKPDTKYMYRIGNNPQAEVRYFKTAPKKSEWSAALISDFHAYAPLPKRVVSAMTMLDTLESRNGGEFDLILDVGDKIAWGGSYSYWKDLYTNRAFKNYVWAGLNGNHDNMDRQSVRLSNNYFRFTNNNPLNGYGDEQGVCYHFTYGDALFITLNNENMRKEEGLKAAQEWVRKVISENPARYIIVMEHYQWFFGNNGKDSQYARWKELFDECEVDLALSGNNHIYARTNAIYQGRETDGSRGTVYLQTTSSDNERGRKLEEWTDNQELIKFRWAEGPHTISGVLLQAEKKKITLTLYDRHGNAIDKAEVKAKKKTKK